MLQYKNSWRQQNALTSAVNYYRANVLLRLFQPQEPFKIEIPTLFIYGEKDTAVLPETIKNVNEAVKCPF
ncbi:MAG: hypothetical protein HC846_08260 [Blastocatellia bacterium]|nr:hypothetical protein [Blastocatellia bacterium]